MMKSIIANSRKHDITFRSDGRIDISAHIARKLSLAPGDVIDIAEDGGELYLYAKLRAGNYVGRHVGSVWATSKGGRCGTFRTCSKHITDAVLAVAQRTNELRCPCGSEMVSNNTKYITIIYRYSL
jgi:anaerobic selenocysteine-containing dehydrogenase